MASPIFQNALTSEGVNMKQSSEEFHFKFRSRLVLGILLLTISVAYYVAALLVSPEHFKSASPLAGPVLLVAGITFCAPHFLVKSAIINGNWIIFKPINFKYPVKVIKQIDQVITVNDRVTGVRMVTEDAPRVWLPGVLVGNNEIVKLSLAGTDGATFLRALESRIETKS